MARNASGTHVTRRNNAGTFTNAVVNGFQVQQVRNAAGNTLVESYGHDTGGRVTSVSRTCYLEDGMGSVIGLAPQTSPGTANTSRLFYDGFGNVRSTAGSTPTVPAGAAGDFRFHGLWLESGTGLYHVRARDYDPVAGRFLSRDPFGGIQEEPESLHPYSFADNNPQLNSDPSGEVTLTDLNANGGMQKTFASMRVYSINRAKSEVYDQVSGAIQQAAINSLRSLLPFDLTSLMQGRRFEEKIRAILCGEAGEVGGYFYFATPVNAEGTPIRSGITCKGVSPESGAISPSVERAGVNNREVGAWIDMVVGSKPPRQGFEGPINKSWLAMEVKLNTKTMVNDYFRDSRKRGQLDSTLNYAIKHTYPRTAVFLVGRYDQKINRKSFPVYERSIQMRAVRRGGFAVVEVVTDFGRSRRKK